MFEFPKWKDVMVFNFAGYSYLLQGKKYKNGKTFFRVASTEGIFSAAQASTLTKDILEKASLWE